MKITFSISDVDKQIKELEKLKAELLRKRTTFDKISESANNWVIEKATNTYYQYVRKTTTTVFLTRKGVQSTQTKYAFNNNFVCATNEQASAHVKFLESQPKYLVVRNPQYQAIDKCEFYMVTCRGINGSKVRHTSYKLAEKEAIRVATQEKHDAFVVGVVSKISYLKN